MKEGTLKEPDRLYIEKGDRDLYKGIKGEDMFSGKDTKELFIIAVAFGFKNKIRKSFQNREGYVRTEYLTDKDKALLYAIALKEADSVDILSNKEEVFKIAEEYAHGGVRILHDSLGQFGSFSKQFEKMLHEIYEELMSEMV